VRETRVTTFRLYIRTYNIYYYYSHFYSCTGWRKICPIKGTFYGSQRSRKTQTCGAQILWKCLNKNNEADDRRILRRFIELTLKSKDDFSAAFDIILSTNLAQYLKWFLIFQPGDWPAQLYSRQIIYETLQKYCCTSYTAQCVTFTPTDHEYATPFTSVHSREAQLGEDSVNISVSQPAIFSVIPCMGPVWQRNCIQRVHGFLWKYLHQALSTKLPKPPRPWRISLVLYLSKSEGFVTNLVFVLTLHKMTI